MELGKIFGAPIQRTDASVRRAVPAAEDTADAFARMLQNFKEMKAAEARDWAEKVGDTVITRILADGTVITQIYQGTKLVSETIEKMKRDNLAQSADPLLAARAAQSSTAAAAASAML